MWVVRSVPKLTVMDQFSQLRRFGFFESNVPRYTSYPPAPQFANDVTPAKYAMWLSQIPAGTHVSLYVHIPFCKRLCWFCACRTQGTPGGSPVSAYVDTLIQEINTLRAALPQGVQAARVFWGGGTPTILPPADITRLARALADAFPHTSATEITVEVDPNEIDDARLDALAAMGMTRASIGVQDFDPEIQGIIGRELSYETTRKVVEGLRSRGVNSLNTDLLYGLPRQTRARIAFSAQMLMSLHPDRVALHGYSHVPSVARRQSLIPTDDLPSPEARLQLFNSAKQVLAWDGYEAIGIDHFALRTDTLSTAARTGHLRRNFQGYGDDTCEVLLGIGASAISRLPQGYAQNAASTAAYQKAARVGKFATAGGHTFVGNDALRARMIEMLMCAFEIDTASVVSEGFGTATRINALLDQIARRFEGQVMRTSKGLSIPAHAIELTRVIARDLDAYHTPTGQSAAV